MRVVRYQFLGADLLEKIINLGHQLLEFCKFIAFSAFGHLSSGCIVFWLVFVV